MSPTMTAQGIILGTAAYMSPEQARGAGVDKRTDLWAFGVVLFEMLTGTRLFQRATTSETLAAVLTTEPDWTALPPQTPPSAGTLLRRCLEKDRRRRLPDAAAARLEIDDGHLTSRGVEVGAAAPRLRPVWRRALPFAAAALCGRAMAASCSRADALIPRPFLVVPPFRS